MACASPPFPLQRWKEICETSAADLVNSIYAFLRKAIRHSSLVRATVVWLVQALSPYGTRLDFTQLTAGLSREQRETLWRQEAKLMVARHKFHSQGRQQQHGSDEEYEVLRQLFGPFEEWLWQNMQQPAPSADA